MKNKLFVSVGLIVVVAVVLFGGMQFFKPDRVIAVYEVGQNQRAVQNLKVVILDPIKDTIVSQRDVVLNHPVGGGSATVVYDKKSGLVYVKTIGNMDTGAEDSGWPEMGVPPLNVRNFFEISSFSATGTDSPVVVYKSDIFQFTQPVISDKNAVKLPYYRLLDPSATRNLEMTFGVNKGTVSDPSLELVSTGVKLHVGTTTKDIAVADGGVDSIYYVVSPDKQSLYFTMAQYDRKQSRDPVLNPFQIGLEKIDARTGAVVELEKNIFPRTTSGNGQYILGYWGTPTGTSLVMFNQKTNVRTELHAFDPAMKPGATPTSLPVDFLLLDWLK